MPAVMRIGILLSERGCLLRFRRGKKHGLKKGFGLQRIQKDNIVYARKLGIGNFFWRRNDEFFFILVVKGRNFGEIS